MDAKAVLFCALVVKTNEALVVKAAYYPGMENETPGRETRQPPCPKCSRKGATVLMVAGSSPALCTYYYCPRPGCKESKKLRRVNRAQLEPINIEPRRDEFFEEFLRRKEEQRKERDRRDKEN